MTDQFGNLVWDGVFDAFGNPWSISGSVTMLLGFPGEYWDSETQLAQNWHRDYDPTTGRYMESDPIGLRGGVNTYAYVLNDPLLYVDRAGTGPLGAAIGGVIGGTILGGAGTAIGPEGTIGGAIEGEDLGAAAGSALEDMILMMASQQNSGRGARSASSSGPRPCNNSDDCDAQADRDEQI